MAILGVVAVAPTVLLGALGVRSARRTVEEEVTRGHLALIRSVGQHLNGSLQDTRRAMMVAAAAWTERSALAPLERSLRRLRSEHEILERIVVLDRAGRGVLGDSPLGSAPLRWDLADTYGGYVSDVLFGPGGRRHVAIVVQARDRKGELLGFLAGVVDLTFVGRRLAEARLGAASVLFLVDGDGRLVATSGPLPAGMEAAATGRRPVRAQHAAVDRVLATTGEGLLEVRDATGRPWVAVYRSLAGMSGFREVRWGVVLQQPADQAYAAAHRATRATVLVALGVLLLALAMGAGLARRITHPITRLVERTEAVAAGQLTESVPPVSAKDEIGQLWNSFSSMVERLREGRESLYALTEFRENLVRSIPLGVISLDREGRIVSLNPAQEELSGVVATEVLGRPLRLVFPGGQEDEGLFARLGRVLSDGLPLDLTLEEVQPPFCRRRCRRYRIRATALRDRRGAVDGAVIVQEDLSGPAELERQLLRSEKLSSVGVLAAGVAHEINNPLTTVLGYAKLLLEGRSETDPDRAALELIAEEARRVQHIVRGLLDFSRVESGARSPTDLSRLVERTLPLLAPELRTRQIGLGQELAEGLPEVLVDAQRLEQVLVNLATNGAQAIGRGGTLTVRTGRDLTEGRPEAVYFDVQDTGPGVAPDAVSKIFDPFFTTKGPGEGTGLGLAICQRIVADHGGTLEVTSAPGQGATFRVRLPLRPAEGATLTAPGQMTIVRP